MIELINILFIIVFSTILLNNIFITSYFQKILKIPKISLVNSFALNIVTIMLILLIASFFKFNYLYLLLFLFLFSLVSLIFNYKTIKLNNFNILSQYLFFILFCLILSVDLVANLKLEWDGHGWYFHALNFKNNFNFFNLENLPRYNHPHLGGIMWGVFWELSFINQEYFGRIFFIIIYVISLLSVSENISNNHIIRFLITSILIFLTYDKFLVSGYQEVLMFSLIVIICNFISRGNLKKNSLQFILFLSLMSSLLIWTKNEGVLFFLIIMIYLIYKQNFKNKIYLTSLAFILLAIKFYLLSFNSPPEEIVIKDYLIIFTSFFFDKIAFIATHTVIAFFKYPIWILFLFIIILEKNIKKNLDIVYFVVTSILLISFIYLMQEIKIFEWMVTGSLDRLIYQSSGFLVLFVSNSLVSIFMKFKNYRSIN